MIEDVLMTCFGRRKRLTCRFSETRLCLRRSVQKLLTALLPTAFKPTAATVALFRFPTSQTGATTLMIVLAYMKEK